MTLISPENAVFVVVSFEGPDQYSQAGGLGVRVTGLVESLASQGYETHLVFIGDPTLAGEEQAGNGRPVLHRWAQWISADCPAGVYDGEARKVDDISAWVPLYLMEHIVRPAIAADRVPVLLFEDWQTAECACRVSEALDTLSVHDRARLAWNANNIYGFERIDWPRLAAGVTITTVSRYMRSIIRAIGFDARVIPNGIPPGSFEPAERDDVTQMRAALTARPDAGMLFKMARWEREKGGPRRSTPSCDCANVNRRAISLRC